MIVLVITIIVIIILAVAVILTLANNNPIQNAKLAVEKNDNATLKEEATLLYADWYLLKNVGEGTDYTAQEYVEEYLSDGYNKELKAKLTVSDDGEITIGGESAKQWALPEGDTEVNVGDLLTPTVSGLANEKFYVIADDGTTLTLLAERNVNTVDNKQASGNNPVAFDDELNVYNGSDIQGLVNAYVVSLTGLDLEDVEVEYNTDPVTGVKGRLMWNEEADSATSPFKDAANYSDILYGPSTARIDYWLGSPFEYDSSLALSVFGYIEKIESSYSVDFEDYFGVRPVIKILKSSVEQ